MDHQAGQRRATYDDIVALPEHVTGELVDGELYTQPRPAGPHAITSIELGGELFGPFGRGRGGPGGWQFAHEPELHLGGDVMVPDIAGWRQARLTAEARQQAFFTVVPDWACEVLSPSTAHRDRAIKGPAYLRHGVQHLWLVEPLASNVDAYTRTDAGWLWLGSWSSRDARIPPFDSVGLDLEAIWARVRGPVSG